MTDLQSLLTRLEEAERPDRGLDGCLDGLVDHDNEAWPPPYTASLDAALALVERALPGWHWEVSGETPARACLWHPTENFSALGPTYAKTPVMALLSGLLRAELSADAKQ